MLFQLMNVTQCSYEGLKLGVLLLERGHRVTQCSYEGLKFLTTSIKTTQHKFSINFIYFCPLTKVKFPHSMKNFQGGSNNGREKESAVFICRKP